MSASARPGREVVGALRGRQIGGKAGDVGRGKQRAHLLQRGADPLLAAAVDDDRRAGARQPLGDRPADAGRGSRHDGLPALQIDMHGAPLLLQCRRWGRTGSG